VEVLEGIAWVVGVPDTKMTTTMTTKMTTQKRLDILAMEIEPD
jgi:hypothetical protein